MQPVLSAEELSRRIAGLTTQIANTSDVLRRLDLVQARSDLRDQLRAREVQGNLDMTGAF